MIPILENFRKNVKYLCKRQGIKLSEVEKEIGVSVGYISRAKDIGVLKVVDVAEMLDTTIDELLFSDAWREDRIKELRAEIGKLIGEAERGIK